MCSLVTRSQTLPSICDLVTPGHTTPPEFLLVPVDDEALDRVEVAAAGEPAGRLEGEHAAVPSRLVRNLHRALSSIIGLIRILQFN